MAEGGDVVSFDLAVGRRELAPYQDGRPVMNSSGSCVAYQLTTPPRESTDGGQRFLANRVPASAVGQRVYVVNVGTATTTAVGPEGAWSWRPWWSPVGKSLAFY
jgi:Tol biopolymer transport system component